MGVVPAVMAGASLIQGVASISAKNKQADAQRAQISAQSQQEAIKQVTNEAILAQNQQLAAAEYNNSVLARMASFMQADYSLQAQKTLADISTTQQQFALASQELEKQQAGVQQLDQIQRNATQASLASDAKRQAADTNTATLADQSSTQLAQVQQELTADQRKQISLQNSGKLASSSFSGGQQRDTMAKLATVLSLGMDADSANVKQALQSMNEQDLASLSEQLGLSDAANSAESVAANLRILRQQSQLASNTVAANNANNQAALDLSRQSNLISSQLDAQNAANAYQAQDYSLGVQRTSGATTSANIQSQYKTAMNNVKGAGLFDYLNTGINVASAATGNFTSNPFGGAKASSPTSSSTRYSGFPTIYSNAG